MNIEAGLGEKNRVATTGAPDVEDADSSGILVLVEQREKALVGSAAREALDYFGIFSEVV